MSTKAGALNSISARACVEDDFHHFRVELTVTAGKVAAIDADSFRFPYVTCPGAEYGLQELVGQPAQAVSSAVFRQADVRTNCTHMLDLAGLAIAQIVNNVPHRRYDVFVSDRHDGTMTGDYTARLALDGSPELHWEASHEEIKSPKLFAGVHLRKGFAKWALSNLPSKQAEAALVLRRCAMISMGRAKNLVAERNAPDWGFCYSQQKERATDALRIKGSIQNFDDRTEDLCRSDLNWIKFEPNNFKPNTEISG